MNGRRVSVDAWGGVVGRWISRVSSQILTQELTGIASAVFDRSSPSPFACSIHEYEFGPGFIQN